MITLPRGAVLGAIGLIACALGLSCSKTEDSNPPTGMSWAYPNGGENIVEPPLTLRVNLSGGLEPRRLRYFLDGELLGVSEESPFAFEWNASGDEVLGPHRLAAVAVNSQNRYMASDTLDIMIPQLTGFYTGTYGGAGADAGYAVEALPNGGFAVAGDLVYPDGNADACLMVFHPGTGARWFRSFGGEQEDHFRGLSVFADGSFALGGWTYLADGQEGPIFWLVRVESNGAYRWSRLLGVPPDFEYAHSVNETGGDGFILAGKGSRGTPAFCLFKADLSGRYVWGRNYPRGEFSIAYSALEIADGGVVAVGSWEEAEVSRLWLVKTNHRGEVGESYPGTWERSYSAGGYYSAGRKLRRSPDGGYVMTGGSDRQLWLLKTDAAGEVGGEGTWSRLHAAAGYDLGLDVRPCANGGYIVTGFTSAGGEAPRDLWLIKTDGEGRLAGPGAWSRVIGGAAMDEGRAVLERSDEGFVVVGYTDSQGGGSSDLWILRTDAQGNWMDE